MCCVKAAPDGEKATWMPLLMSGTTFPAKMRLRYLPEDEQEEDREDEEQRMRGAMQLGIVGMNVEATLVVTVEGDRLLRLPLEVVGGVDSEATFEANEAKTISRVLC